VLSHSISNTSLCKQCAPQIGVSVSTLGMHREDFLVLENGFIRAALAQKCAREIVLRILLVWDGCEAGGVLRDGTIQITFGYERVRQVARGLGVVRSDFECL